MGGRGSVLGTAGELLDEVFELQAPLLELCVALLSGSGCPFIAALTGVLEVRDGAFDAGPCGVEVVDQDGGQGLGVQAVDGDPGDEGLLAGGERPVDGLVLVHPLVDVSEEIQPQPATQRA